jgi:hypothetical protein
VVHISNSILFNHKKEWNPVICSNMNGTWDNYIKWAKIDKDKYHVISLIYGVYKSWPHKSSE